MHALIIEDDGRQAEYLQTALDEIGIDSTVRTDGETGLDTLRAGGFDIVLLDIRLPGVNGIDVVRSAKASGDVTPIILLTAQDSVNTRCAGLDAGADDYLPKPFSFDELKSRINAVMRRSKPQPTPTSLRYGDLVMDTCRHTVTRGGRPVGLTQQEYNLLECFLRDPQGTLTRRQLIGTVWHCGNISKNVVDVRICNLRRKINGPGERPLIRTVQGFGYALV